MKAEFTETLWLDERHEFSLAELAELSGLSEAELRELVDYGAVVPRNPQALQWTFSGTCLDAIRTACRLRDSFDLDVHGVAVVIALLDRIHDLEAQLRHSRAQVPRGTR